MRAPALFCCGAFLLAGDVGDRLLPVWCGKTTELVTSLQEQSYVSRGRSEKAEATYEWFVGPREVIVLQHNQNGTSCIAAEAELLPPTARAKPSSGG
jgi:hypothetical protein